MLKIPAHWKPSEAYSHTEINILSLRDASPIVFVFTVANRHSASRYSALRVRDMPT